MATSLSPWRDQDLPEERAFLDSIEQLRHSGGSVKGSYAERWLLADPNVLRHVPANTVDS